MILTFSKMADFLLITPAKFWVDLLTGGDLTTNVAALTDQINLLEAESVRLFATIEENKDNTIANSIFGNQEENQERLGEVLFQLTELKSQREKLTAASIKEDKKAAKSSTDLAKTVKKTGVDINKSLNASLGRGVASSIQKLATNLATGENLFDGFGKFVLAMMGDMAIQIGTVIVATSVAQLALLGSPLAGIATGAALIAIGAILKARFGGGSSGALGSAGGGAAGSAAAGGTLATPIAEEAALEPEELEPTGPATNVVVNIQGDVLDSEETGLRIVDLVNNAFDREGVTFNQGTA